MTTNFTDPDLMAIRAVTPHTPNRGEECLELGTPWVHHLAGKVPVVQPCAQSSPTEMSFQTYNASRCAHKCARCA